MADFDFSTLITDRAAADLTKLETLESKPLDQWTAEELAWFNAAALRGSYDYTDLNRVTACMEYLDALLQSYGYSAGYVPVEIEAGRTVWREEDPPTESLMAAYLANVAALRGALELTVALPDTPETMAGLTTDGANAIEQILWSIDYVIQQIVNAFARSNAFTFWSGNRPFPSARSDLGRNWAELDAMGTGWRNWQVATWYLLLYGNLEAEGDVV